MGTKYEPVVTKDGDIETAVSCPDQTPVAKTVEEVTHMKHRHRRRPFLKGVIVGVVGTLLFVKIHMHIRRWHRHHHRHPGHHHPGRHHGDDFPPMLTDTDFYGIPEHEMWQEDKKMWDDMDMDMDMDIEKKMWHDKKMHGHHGMKMHGGKMHGHHGMKMHGGKMHGHHGMHHHQKHMVDEGEPEIMILEEELNSPEEELPVPELAAMETEETEEEELNSPEEELPVPALAAMETEETEEEVIRRDESP